MSPSSASARVAAADLPRVHNGGYIRVGASHTATCRGTGKAVHRAYRAFTCRVVTPGETFTAWARVTGTGFCVSSVGPTVCAAPAGRNDPRVCAPDRVDECVHAAAVQAARLHAGGGTLFQGVTECDPAGAFVFACQLGDTAYRVVFTRTKSGWTSTVTPVT